MGRSGKNVFAIPSGLTVHHSVTGSLVFPIESVGGWVHLGFLDGLIDSKKAHHLVRYLVKGTQVLRGLVEL